MDNLPAIAADLPNVSKAQSNAKLPSSPPVMAALCPDWILSNNSNVHTAVDRGWFITYTPYKTHLIDDVFGGPPIAVCGIGTVTIQVLKHKVSKGKRSQRTITLHNVLHTPTAPCNILGGPFLVESKGNLSSSDWVLRGQDGSILALFELHPKQPPQPAGAPQLSGLPRLKLRQGPNITFAESKLEPNTGYVIRATWPDAERRKYINHCDATASAATSATSGDTSATIAPVPPLTEEEKDWLKHRSGYKDEFHLLRPHGLRINREEDREEGRQILRTLMVNSDSGEGDDDEEDEEWDPTGHQADYPFKCGELDFIEKHWGTSENFLITHGLKFYDNDDLEEGGAIVRALMGEDE